ncbi:hypothetical protein [Paenibacillus validus]|uniref:hypothetical protein n=1 Tax=Paenibacillus validus TaxID=44253 RepID=UPI003D2D6F03
MVVMISTISLYQKEAVFFYFCNLHIQSAIFTVTSMLYAGFRSAKVELLTNKQSDKHVTGSGRFPITFGIGRCSPTMKHSLMPRDSFVHKNDAQNNKKRHPE